ncbi:MAG: hypothetical protein LBQ09_02840 [Acidobacteriaceae bacterium]|jgi:hypothetical protein|nr:hypothetical protein [Acidobacteriaceae bacterium]
MLTRAAPVRQDLPSQVVQDGGSVAAPQIVVTPMCDVIRIGAGIEPLDVHSSGMPHMGVRTKETTRQPLCEWRW